MTMTNWQLQTPIDAVILDCDGTMSSIEGVDELAKNKGTYAYVQALTAEAMNKTGITPELYQKRLNLILPERHEVLALSQRYYHHRTPEIENVVSILTRLNKPIYVVSAGIYLAVSAFAELLHIPPKQVFAVNVKFDQDGRYQDYDRSSPLIKNDGKAFIVQQLKKVHKNMIYVGDGLNDVVVRDLVLRFIGYGGSFYRENIARLCQYYIKIPTFAPILPLSLTVTEYQQLTPHEKTIYDNGVKAIDAGEVEIKKYDY